MDFQLEEARMRQALERIRHQKIVVHQNQTGLRLCFPIMVDRLSRDKLTSERLEDRVKRMVLTWSED